MRTILGALALVIAAPAVAQGAPASDQHAGHAQHEGQRGERQHDGHDGDHKMDGCKDCCDKMKQSGGKMECMDMKGEAKPASTDASAHEGHAGH